MSTAFWLGVTAGVKMAGWNPVAATAKSLTGGGRMPAPAAPRAAAAAPPALSRPPVKVPTAAALGPAPAPRSAASLKPGQVQIGNGPVTTAAAATKAPAAAPRAPASKPMPKLTGQGSGANAFKGALAAPMGSGGGAKLGGGAPTGGARVQNAGTARTMGGAQLHNAGTSAFSKGRGKGALK